MHKIAQAPPEAQNKRLIIAKIVVVILYAVGVIGLSLPEYREMFLKLTPAQLLVSLVILLGFHKGWNEAFPIFATAAFWIGFGAEAIGIHTGYLFGDYVYGPTLGPKLWDVPIVIGVNWFLLVYLTGTVFHRTTDNDYYAALLGATAMVVIDYILEPVAVALDMWYWKFDIIPSGNYFSWFAVAFLIHLIYRKANFERENPLAAWMLICMVLFFTILNFTLGLK
ncbi:carotenoid biosynthesis protein [Algoriphagus sp. NG3]|uniref:carotenoid biosynthesis protein n=1 Tax=unclassified Algoriphagus TaxID=2641541 RepID=UPI002A809468|nr:carotenoid biosynthesis protein [Algoriphagus sp. NG3]WPR74728.1 carotenoid biosynthesis protein [Algoriphagus sp. NG3]